MPRSVALLAVIALMGPLVGGVASGAEPNASRQLVGYDPAHEDAALLAIQAAGGETVRTSRELGVALVYTDDPSTFRELAGASPYVQYVENDDAIGLAGGQWNGAQWNGAQWNGGQWNGAQWNDNEWNGAQWNDDTLKDVSEAQRQAAKWTEHHYEVSSDTKMRFAGDSTDPGMVWQWGTWATRGPDGWVNTGKTGTRTASLCVLDSGVAWDHSDIAPNFADAHNAIDPSASGYDDGGHGTHIAGIAAGALTNAYGVGGVGNVRILSAKVLDSEGYGHESDLAFGLVWCAKSGADVAVMALSATEPGPTMDRALQYNAVRDVLLMASAGNAGPCSDCVAYPASDPRVMAVSAIDGDLALAPFSSRGPQVELAAPGVYVLGPFPGDAFVFGSGTSQAVAMAAGLATLVRDAHPDLSATDTRALLKSSARDLGAAGVDDAFGHGLLQVEGALLSA